LKGSITLGYSFSEFVFVLVGQQRAGAKITPIAFVVIVIVIVIVAAVVAPGLPRTDLSRRGR